MKTITTKHTVFLAATKSMGEYKYEINMVDMTDYGSITVESKEIEISMEVPEGYNPVSGHIDALKEEKQKIAAKAQVEMNNLEEQIQSMLAIECDS